MASGILKVDGVLPQKITAITADGTSYPLKKLSDSEGRVLWEETTTMSIKIKGGQGITLPIKDTDVDAFFIVLRLIQLSPPSPYGGILYGKIDDFTFANYAPYSNYYLRVRGIDVTRRVLEDYNSKGNRAGVYVSALKGTVESCWDVFDVNYSYVTISSFPLGEKLGTSGNNIKLCGNQERPFSGDIWEVIFYKQDAEVIHLKPTIEDGKVLFKDVLSGDIYLSDDGTDFELGEMETKDINRPII